MESQSNFLEDEVRTNFPNAQKGGVFVCKLNLFLDSQGFTPYNTRFSTICCSESDQSPECVQMYKFWGSRFKAGGLGGYAHGGKTGFAAVSHHIPNELNEEGGENLIMFGGPHIGLKDIYNHYKWGEVQRTDQKDVSQSCGSIKKCLTGFLNGQVPSAFDPKKLLSGESTDIEQNLLEHILHRWYEENSEHHEGNVEELIVAATKYIAAINTEHMSKVIEEGLKATTSKSSTKYNIALVSGVTINTGLTNYFEPSHMKMFSAQYGSVRQQDFNVE